MSSQEMPENKEKHLILCCFLHLMRCFLLRSKAIIFDIKLSSKLPLKNTHFLRAVFMRLDKKLWDLKYGIFKAKCGIFVYLDSNGGI
jgi:hypothetical protein